FPCHLFLFSFMLRPPPSTTLFPYTTLFRSGLEHIFEETVLALVEASAAGVAGLARPLPLHIDLLLAAAVVRVVHTARHITVQLRSEEHTSELQSRFDLVCRLLLEKKNVHSQ